MNGSPYGNAMTEIALALAMGFFSLMVLTMISMGAGGAGDGKKSAATVSASAEMNVAERTENTTPNGQAGQRKADKLVVFWNGNFLDGDLNSVDPATLAADGRVILALPPDLPMVDALATRGRFTATDLVVSTLDAAWLARLQQHSGKE